MAQTTISQLELAQIVPYPKQLEKLARVFGVEPHLLMDDLGVELVEVPPSARGRGNDRHHER